ncbi:hypothetical protein BDV26DRAFT_288237 [Aspergillus bertholletiae]|uniref:Uncharacterized protein n=1 Tax=Aspergillus bertholletiae TaxID=1226010 RepID=A0A5N7BLQ2_9EURO|nr:hypothetical protein BDV26DRAFT_288237 [Aspergillus bertholletiae]
MTKEPEEPTSADAKPAKASQEDAIPESEIAQLPITPEGELQEGSQAPSSQEEKSEALMKRRRSERLNKGSVSPTDEVPATPPSPPKKIKVEGEEPSSPALQSSVPEAGPAQSRREGSGGTPSPEKDRPQHPSPTSETVSHGKDQTQYPDSADCPGYYFRRATWLPYSGDEIHKKLCVVQERLQDWSVEWATLEKQLSEEEKQKLIAGLKGYCVQTDWASLVEKLPSNICELLPLVLSQALVAKDLFQKVIEDPFFYLNESGEKVTGRHGQVFIPSRAEIHNLWRWFEPSSVREKWHSRKWRQMTIRFLNAYTPETTFDPLLATHMKRLRDSRLERLVSNLLDESALLHPLLKTVTGSTTVDRRYQELLHVYQIAADLCIGMWTNEMDFEFGSFTSLGEFHEDIQHMGKHSYAEYESTETFDSGDKGRAVVFMLQPTITRYCQYEREEDESLIHRAVVIFSKDATM